MERPTPPEPPQKPPGDEPPPTVERLLERIEALLSELRGVIDARTREQEHQRFSPALLIGTALQMLCVGLLVLAVMDWVFNATDRAKLMKLAYGGMLQLMACAAFLLALLERR